MAKRRIADSRVIKMACIRYSCAAQRNLSLRKTRKTIKNACWYRRSVAEIYELQRQAERLLAQERDHLL